MNYGFLYTNSLSRGFYFSTTHVSLQLMLINVYAYPLNINTIVLLLTSLSLVFGSYFDANVLLSNPIEHSILVATIVIINYFMILYFTIRFGKALPHFLYKFSLLLQPIVLSGITLTAFDFVIGYYILIPVFILLYCINIYSWIKIIYKAGHVIHRSSKVARMMRYSNILGGILLTSPFIVFLTGNSIDTVYICYFYFPSAFILVVLSDLILNMNKYSIERSTIWVQSHLDSN